MSTTNERYPRPTAIHEAGHAVVAWSFGLPLGAVWISADDASGGAEIGPAHHLKLTDQIAVRCAGGIAEEVFECPGHELSTFNDGLKIMELLEEHGFTEENGAATLRQQGYDIAAAILTTHRTVALALAEELVQHGRLEAAKVSSLLNGEAA